MSISKCTLSLTEHSIRCLDAMGITPWAERLRPQAYSSIIDERVQQGAVTLLIATIPHSTTAISTSGLLASLWFYCKHVYCGDYTFMRDEAACWQETPYLVAHSQRYLRVIVIGACDALTQLKHQLSGNDTHVFEIVNLSQDAAVKQTFYQLTRGRW